MITDQLRNASLYYDCHPEFKKAFEFLMSDTSQLQIGKHVIDGDKMFALVQKCDTKPEGAGAFEAHRRYIDIQYIVKGNEGFCYTNPNTLSPKTEYDAQKDAQHFLGAGTRVTLTEGEFIVFFPEDAHLCCISPDGGMGCSEKIVVKVLV